MIVFVVAAGCILPAIARPGDFAAAPRGGSLKSDPGLSATTRGEMTLDIRAAIERGLAYIARSQNRDGSWTEMVGRKISDNYENVGGGINDRNIGVTAIAAIAFMSHGDVPGRGRYGENVRKALQFIMSCQKTTGFMTRDESRMYEHSFATLALAEAYGMTHESTFPEKYRLKEVLCHATEQIVIAQNAAGAWRYLPQATDSDISVTVTTLMALRAARNVGIYVPKTTIERALDYIRRSAESQGSYRLPSGAFWYQYEDARDKHMSRYSFQLTAAGVASLMYAGEYNSSKVKQGIKFLEQPHRRVKWGRFGAYQITSFEYFYGLYYAAQVFFQVGGEKWKNWYSKMSAEILGVQRPDGSWLDQVGPNYATAMACVILEMPYRYLPLFLR
jgi:hypothetical protein